jgi:hypothetical protein
MLAATLACAAPAAAQTPGLPPIPIPGDPLALLNDVPAFTGQIAEPRPLNATSLPQNPFMAPNGRNNIHDDAYMSDTYRYPGPLGDGPEASTLFTRECGSITFDSQGRLVTICVGLDRPVLALLEPHTLTTLAAYPLPFRNILSGTNPLTDFSGGGYFYLDNHDRAVLPTNDKHLLVIAETNPPGFQVTRDYDLSAKVAQNDGIVSVLPDWDGRFWFVTRQGVVGTVDRATGTVRTRALAPEGISNSFSVDESGGVYIVSDKALYRFDAGQAGQPTITWRVVYPNSGIHKPGQSDAGSGTTPTVMGRNWVAITDNADPMDVVVYRRGAGVAAGDRLVCSEPVFEPGAGDTDQSLIGFNNSLITENNYGYTVGGTLSGGVTEPGITRVDVVKGDCRTVWESDERAPSVVPKLSLANGLVYSYTKPKGATYSDAWYLTALDFRTGRTVYRRLAGTGLGYNNNYAPVTLAADGTAYVGVLGGVVAFNN